MREFLPRDFFDLPADGDDEAIVGRGPNIFLRERAARLAARRLNQPVGERQPNESDDVAQVETFVRATGDLDFRPDSDPTGLFSAPLRDATRRFQRRSGLTVDGIVNPDGETVDALRQEIGFDEEEADQGRPGSEASDPDGSTQLGLRCRQVAVDLGNTAFEVEDIDREIDASSGQLEAALDRVRNAEALPADIALTAASIGANLAARNWLAAILEAVDLAGRLVGSTSELNTASHDLNVAAEHLSDTLEGRDALIRQKADLEAERDRLGCRSIGF